MSGQGKVYILGFDFLPVLHQGIGRPTSRQGDGNEDDPATNFQEDREKCKIEAEVRAVNCQWVLGWLGVLGQALIWPPLVIEKIQSQSFQLHLWP